MLPLRPGVAVGGWVTLDPPEGPGVPQRREEGTVCSTACEGMDECMSG